MLKKDKDERPTAADLHAQFLEIQEKVTYDIEGHRQRILNCQGNTYAFFMDEYTTHEIVAKSMRYQLERYSLQKYLMSVHQEDNM